MILGIDPGTKEGAAVFLDRGRVDSWAVWSRVVAGYRVTRSGLQVSRVVSMAEVGALVAGRSVSLAILAIEGTFGGCGAQPLAESVGELRVGLRSGLTWGEVIRPLAVERSKNRPPGWRKKVLGLPDRMAAEKAEEAAIIWAGARLPFGLTRAEQGAWSEALAIAEYGRMKLEGR